MQNDIEKLEDKAFEQIKNQTQLILENTKEYIKAHKIKKSRKTEGYSTEFCKIVIPKIKPIPKYKFYMESSNLIATLDDPVLRYLPVTKDNSEYEKINYFDATILSDRPFDKYEQLKETVMQMVFKNYTNYDLFKLKRDAEEKKITMDYFEEKFPLILAYSKFYDIKVYKILVMWETMFDKNREILYHDKEAFNSYFCSTCLIFDCSIHNGSYKFKPLKPNNDQVLVTKKSIKNIHSDFCSKKIDEKKKSKLNEEIYGDEIDFISSNFKAEPCILNMFFYFCAHVRLDCKFFRKKINLKEKEIMKKIVARKRLGNMKTDIFYTPCSHPGNCSENPDCYCFKSNIYCEDSCFCECCDNLYPSCGCKKCDYNCGCVKRARECGVSCTCQDCDNRPFTEKRSKLTFVGASNVEGFGLFAGEDIKKGEFIIEYTGEVITNLEAERRGQFYEKRHVSYLFDASYKNGDTHHTIDAMMVGNSSRFANHSNQPNLKAKTIQAQGIKRIGFFAARDIKKDEELFFDYQYKEEYKAMYNIKE